MTASDAENDTKLLIERQKVMYDTLKHLTTLNSGAILFYATLHDKFIPKQAPVEKTATALIFGCFAVSLIVAFFGMVGLSGDIGRTGMPDSSSRFGGAVAMIAFLLGLLGIAYRFGRLHGFW